MTDPVLDDPGELLRFWLWHEQRHTVRSFKIANLATALTANSRTVSAWIARNAIPTIYWNAIARFFGRGSYHEIEDEARLLWADKNERRGYTPLYKLQVKRAGVTQRASTRAAEPVASARLRSAGTPERVGEYLRQRDAANELHPPQRPARTGRGRRSHGKQPVA